MNTLQSALMTTVPCRRGKQAGFTLIEMMISITIGLGILAGLVGVLSANSSNSRTNDRTSELMTNGRYALNSMKQELRQAGFRGYSWADPSTPDALALTNECLETGATAGAFVANIRQGIWGANDSNPFSASCIPDASYAALGNNDVLVLRRLGVIPSTTLSANTVYFNSSYERGRIFQGLTPPVGFTGSNFPLQTYVYYISPFTEEGENPQIPALYRVALRSSGEMQRELVASGIERMQVQYGRLTTVPDTRYSDTITGTSFDALPSDWDAVNSVRIWLLARNETAEPGYTNTNSYVMGDQAAFVPNDGFRRQLFTTVVQLRN